VSPDTIGNYRLEAPLGESGLGVVYRAVALDTGRVVAVKRVSPDKFADAAARRKFLEEARAAQRLSHPHLRQLYEVGESGDLVYLVMEYLEGVTLKSLLVSGRVEAETALAWGAEVAAALAAVHAAGVVHGDLSAYNVLYWEGEIRIIDFPQMVDPHANPDARAIFNRDVDRLCQYFARYGVQANAVAIAREFWRRHVPVHG